MATEIVKKAALGTYFWKNKPDLDRFWGAWGGHWEGLGWNFGPKKGNKKNKKKKDGSRQASAGNADPGKEGFWEDMDKQGLTRPNPVGLGGRIVYASRIPPRPHEAFRLGGFEEGRGRCLEKSRILYYCNNAILTY